MFFEKTKHWVYEYNKHRCTGIEIAGLVAMLAGTGASEYANVASKNAMNDATNAELQRQKDYTKQGQAAFQQSLSQSGADATHQQMQAGQANALREYQHIQQGRLPGLGLDTATINPSASNAGVQDAIVGSRVGQQNTAAAALQGYQSSDVAQSIKDLQARTALGQIGNFSRSSQSVLPLELQAAQHKYDSVAGIGSLLQSAGGLASLAGLVSAPATVGATSATQLGALGAGYGPVSAGYAASLPGLSPYLAGNTLQGLGYGGFGSLSTFGGF